MNTVEAKRLIAALRHRGITDERVLAAIAAVPRKAFVDPAHTDDAYEDQALPIACGQTISQPYVVAYMTEKLGLTPELDVLEIGTGSGYQAAVLARLARHVYTIERHEPLLAEALRRFQALGISTITAIAGDGSLGWPDARAFDRIIVTAAATQVPQALLDQLRPGGRMILPLGARPFRQRLVLFDKTGDGVQTTNLLAVRFVPLVGDPG
jgi:protein-L-isoaspartate(D-aspartate) O-methyltransferase